MLKVLSSILCDLDPKVKVIGQKAGICDGVPSTSALVYIILLYSVSRSAANVFSLSTHFYILFCIFIHYLALPNLKVCRQCHFFMPPTLYIFWLFYITSPFVVSSYAAISISLSAHFK